MSSRKRRSTPSNNGDIFDDTWWPLESAVAWVLSGNRATLNAGARSPGLLFAAKEALSQDFTDPRKLYRRDAQEVPDPYLWALDQIATLFRKGVYIGRGRHAGARKDVPPKAWRAESIVSGKGGLVIRTGTEVWRQIEVPSGPLKKRWPAKRGRRTVGTPGAQASHADVLTREVYLERLRSGESLPTLSELEVEVNDRLDEDTGPTGRAWASARSTGRIVRALDAKVQRRATTFQIEPVAKRKRRGRRGRPNAH